MNSTWIRLSQLRSWHRPALIGQRWKIRDGIDDGIVTTNCLEMLYLRDFLDKVGTDFPLRSTKVWPVPIVFFGIVDGIGASRPCESPPDKGAARRLTIEWESWFSLSPNSLVRGVCRQIRVWVHYKQRAAAVGQQRVASSSVISGREPVESRLRGPISKDQFPRLAVGRRQKPAPVQARSLRRKGIWICPLMVASNTGQQ